MKSKSNIILIIIGIAFSLSLKSQNVSGTIKYVAKHSWSKKYAAVDYISKAEKERIVYVWGHNDEWKQYGILTFNQTTSEYKEIADEEEKYKYNYSERTQEYIIHRNFETNRMYDVIRMSGKLYLIDDTITPINWKIKNDMREIAGHICMNAAYTDTLLNKNIVAWFALDMPYSFGPEKYYGLPGMILEIDMNNGAVVITAEKVELSQSQIEIPLPKHKKPKVINQHDYYLIIAKTVSDCKKQKIPYFYRIRY